MSGGADLLCGAEHLRLLLLVLIQLALQLLLPLVPEQLALLLQLEPQREKKRLKRPDTFTV